MTRRAMIDSTTNVVVNVISWDGVSSFRDYPGCFSVECDKYVQKGNIYDPQTQTFSRPVIPPSPEEIAQRAAEQSAINCTVMLRRQFEREAKKDPIKALLKKEGIR